MKDLEETLKELTLNYIYMMDIRSFFSDIFIQLYINPNIYSRLHSNENKTHFLDVYCFRKKALIMILKSLLKKHGRCEMILQSNYPI